MTMNKKEAGLPENDLFWNAVWVSKMEEEKRYLNQKGGFEMTNGDQTPVTGLESQVLRLMWNKGGDYNPWKTSSMSQWSVDCYEGKLVEIKKHLAQNPNLLQQRESTLRMGGLHHIIAGARTINPFKCNKGKFLEDEMVKVTKLTDHVKCLSLIHI